MDSAFRLSGQVRQHPKDGGVTPLSLGQVVAIAAVVGIVALVVGFLLRKSIAEARIGSAEQEAVRILNDASKEAERKQKESVLQAKEEIHAMRSEFEEEIRQRRSELQEAERRLANREEAVERRVENLDEREDALKSREENVQEMEQEARRILDEHVKEMERIAGLTREEAQAEVMAQIEKDARREAAILARDIENEARENAQKKAREIVSLAIQRCAADQVSDTTVSVVELPSDDMKGRIIGREGRNIRAFESLTGVDLIIDDTPEAVVISSFDPIRREKARLTLVKLVADGRIHPARIEEMYEKVEREIEEQIRETGQQAAYDAGVHGLHPRLTELLGRLKFRSSYGQNVLQHSMEVSHLAAVMASELGTNNNLARRAGLLHDIGKAVDHEVQGTHVDIGRDLLRRYGEKEEVIAGMSAHHGDYEAESVEAVLITAADALSAARPGARRETLEAYIQRLSKLEDIADSFQGVEESYAIQAGREIRIMVKPDEIDDLEAYSLARDIVKKVEEQVEYPGQVKVTVIRQTRAVEYAK
ncbi:MAG: ribonuclease Y [Bacillota bacterium]